MADKNTTSVSDTVAVDNDVNMLDEMFETQDKIKKLMEKKSEAIEARSNLKRDLEKVESHLAEIESSLPEHLDKITVGRSYRHRGTAKTRKELSQRCSKRLKLQQGNLSPHLHGVSSSSNGYAAGLQHEGVDTKQMAPGAGRSGTSCDIPSNMSTESNQHHTTSDANSFTPASTQFSSPLPTRQRRRRLSSTPPSSPFYQHSTMAPTSPHTRATRRSLRQHDLDPTPAPLTPRVISDLEDDTELPKAHPSHGFRRYKRTTIILDHKGDGYELQCPDCFGNVTRSGQLVGGIPGLKQHIRAQHPERDVAKLSDPEMIKLCTRRKIPAEHIGEVRFAEAKLGNMVDYNKQNQWVIEEVRLQNRKTKDGHVFDDIKQEDATVDEAFDETHMRADSAAT